MTPTLTTRPREGQHRLVTPGTGRDVQRWLQVVSHTDPRYGGLSSAVPALAAALGESDALQIALAAFCHSGEEVLPPAMTDVTVTFWPASRVAWWKDRVLFQRFEASVREADGVHIHGLWEGSTAVACQVARKLGKPYVLSAHGMLEPWALQAKRLKKQIYAALLERKNVAGAACLQALTPAEETQYRQFGARGPVAVIPNAVGVPRHTSAELFLDQFPELRGKRLVLFLSRLHPKKGLDLLVGAWSQVASHFPGAHLVIAGPDAEGTQARLTTQLREDRVDDTVTFTGLLAGDMKWSALTAAECFVLPSYSEGLSMALLEAMGVGTPVLATRACNMPDITRVDAGWEIEATVDALTSALDAVLSGTPAANAAKGAKGARLIASKYTRASVVEQTRAMYEAVLTGEASKQMQGIAGGAQ